MNYKLTFWFSRKSSAASLLCARKTNKRKRQNSPFQRDKNDVPPYEEMSLYYPQSNVRRPLILVGPPSIGRHELRQRLLDDTSRFAAPIPRKFQQNILFHWTKLFSQWIEMLFSSVVVKIFVFIFRHFSSQGKWGDWWQRLPLHLKSHVRDRSWGWKVPGEWRIW